jgi:glycosyltransferase involved in cell wall biosynthesis
MMTSRERGSVTLESLPEDVDQSTLIDSSISLVVPVYNSEATLVELTDRICSVLTPLVRSFEIILVNDGSRDESWEVITELAEQNPNVRGLNLMRNYGQHNALLCGIRVAQNEIIVTMDDDLQHPPEEIPKLLEKLAEGYDVVYGAPRREQHGAWRDIASQVTKLALHSVMGAATARNVSAFRALRTQVCDAFVNYRSRFVSIDVLLTWGTTRFAAVSVRHDPRRIGASNYTFRKLAVHALNMLTGFSVLPLRLASFVGFSFTVFGLGVLIYVIGRYLIEGGSVPGFPFLASVIAIFSGAQLFALGIIGEYLARMHYRLMERPTYVIRQQACSGVGEKSSAKNILHILDQPGRLAISEQPDRLDCTSNVIHLKGN